MKSKKAYSSPAIKFYPLAASAPLNNCSLAGSTNVSDNSCQIRIDGWDEVIFSHAVGCDYNVQDGKTGLCYGIMTQDSTIFSS